MSYCSRTDLRARLSEVGIVYVADSDADGEAANNELATTSDKCIEESDTEINAALTPHFPASYLPISGNDWLKYRAIDIAAERMAENGGGGVPASLVTAAQRSREWLELVRKGELRVPGLTYPVDGFLEERRKLGIPRSANPCCKRRGCS